MSQQRHYTLFRALTSGIFLYAGFKHLFESEKIVSRIKLCTLYSWHPSPVLYTGLAIASGVVMIIAALFLLFGKWQQWAAAILLIVLVGITLTIQLENLRDLGPFFKNVAIAGSLIFLLKHPKYEYQKA